MAITPIEVWLIYVVILIVPVELITETYSVNKFILTKAVSHQKCLVHYKICVVAHPRRLRRFLSLCLKEVCANSYD